MIRSPSDLFSAVWFEDILHNNRYKKRKVADSEVNLILDMEHTELASRYEDLARVSNINNALYFVGKSDSVYQVFNMKRIRYLEKKYDVNILLYELNDDSHISIPTRMPKKLNYALSIHLLVKPGTGDSLTKPIENFDVIVSSKYMPKLLKCTVLKNCAYETYHKSNFVRHCKKCEQIGQKQIICRQRSYGDEKTVISEMVEDRILPVEMLKYRNYYHATFDIETIENKIHTCQPARGTTTDANLVLLSIAIGSNLAESFCS